MQSCSYHSREYYQQREQKERMLAGIALMPSIRAVHLELADHYAELAQGADVKPVAMQVQRTV